MKSQDESFSMLRDYIGFDRRTLLIFLALVAGVFVVVTGIYIAIFGFKDWETNMQRAGSMMVANFNTPATGGIEDLTGPRAPRPRPAAVPAAVQYTCPNCGAVGLPHWSPNGTPICPNCGSVMTVAGRAGANARLAARP